MQVAVKPYLIYENGYEYTPPGTPKPPTASQVPDVIQGAVEMSIFNPGTTPITVRLAVLCRSDGICALAPHEPAWSVPSDHNLLQLPGRATVRTAPLVASCGVLELRVVMKAAGQEDARVVYTLPCAQGNALCAHAQTPYTIEVASTQYKELLNVYNANLYSNLTSDGTAAFTVVNAYQDVQPNYNNVVEITYTVFSKSQVTPASGLWCVSCTWRKL